MQQDGATMCELWFRVDQANQYTEMIRWLKERHVSIGLHYWGLVRKNIKPNLAANDAEVRQATIEQVKNTIDIAARTESVYVNVHPGAVHLEELNLKNWQQRMIAQAGATEAQAQKLFLDAAGQLDQYARGRGVMFTVETLCGLEIPAREKRNEPYDPGNLPLSVMKRWCQIGGWLANDISHTLTNIARRGIDEATAWEQTEQFTQETAEQTKLLHINTISPPLAGTDSHDGITPDDFARGVFPSQAQIKKFLAVFAARDDVIAVPEPQDGTMQANYRALKEIIEDL